jgi:ABC-type lipoprotein release transport system permease subunit
MRYVFKEFRRHLWRNVSSIIGYIIASMFIILIIAVTDNNEKESVNVLKGTGTHFIIYVPSRVPFNNVPFNTECCSEPLGTGSCNIPSNNNSEKQNARGSLYADGVYTKLLSRNFLNQIKQTEGVKEAIPYLLYKIYVEQFKSEVSIGGIVPNSIAAQNNVCAPNNIIEGKFLSSDTSEIVAEGSFAQAFALHLGDTINFCNKKLKLVGIINSGVKPGKADLYSTFDNLKYILKDNLKLNMSGSDFNVVLVEVGDARNQIKVMDAVKIQNQYASVSSYNCFKPATSVMTIIGKASAILYGIIFLFLIIFATKTQTTLLMERLREIGILKSLGWSNIRIGKQIFAGSVIQAFIGSILGIFFAAVTLLILNHSKIILTDTSLISVHWYYFFFVCGLSLTGGLIASLLPILRIYRLSAGDIMRNYL